MQKKIFFYITSIIILFVTLNFSGCSSSLGPKKIYNSKKLASAYPKQVKLPADYPTRYLPNGDLWDEVRDNLRLVPSQNNSAIQYQIRWYKNHQDFLNRCIQRGAPYLYYIYQQCKRLNLPPELAFIPIIEGGYNPAAHNRSSGAGGMWQFMPGTARGFGLKINHYYDGRRDIVASTNAALKYFTYLHYFFNKDWLLAVAAYDTGEGNVQSAIMRNQRNRLPINFWSLRLASETRSYVPQLLALSAIIKNPNRYDIALTPVNNGAYFEQINVGQQIDIRKAAKMADTNYDYFKILNAPYLRGVTDPDGPYTLLIPKNKVALFKKNLENGTYISTHDDEAETETTESKTTTAAADNATAAAINTENAGTTKTTAAAIAENNQATNKTISSTENAAENNIEKTSAASNELIQDNTTASSTKTASTPSENNSSAKTYYITRISFRHHTVRRHETLNSIAARYHTTASELRKLNKLKTSSIRHKRTLLVPIKEEVAVKHANKSETTTINNADIDTAKNNTESNTNTNTEAVSNDVNNEKEKTSVKTSISTAKQTKNSDTTASAKTSDDNDSDNTMDNTSDETSSSAETANNTETTVINTGYKVKRGDSLASIASKFGTSAKELRRINHIKTQRVRPGKFLIVPTRIQTSTMQENSSRESHANEFTHSENATRVKREHENSHHRTAVPRSMHNNRATAVRHHTVRATQQAHRSVHHAAAPSTSKHQSKSKIATHKTATAQHARKKKGVR